VSSDRGLDPIASVEVAIASFPLPDPFQLGTVMVSEREFAFVRITTEAGLEGAMFVLSREPLVELVEHDLAPLLVGRDADAIARRVEDCQHGAIGPGRPGLRTRCVSLIEIALWDIKARRAGLPLWRLLGGYRADHPCLIVPDYLVEGGDIDAHAERSGELGRQGFPLLKLKRASSPDLTRRVLAATRAALPDDCGIVVDGAWVWQNAGEAVRELHAWGDPELRWLEDPFPASDVRSTARLRAAGAVPIAVGDEVSDPHQLERLIEADALDVVRVDATSLGGIEAYRRVATLAIASGLEVSSHVYPEVHVHCAAAWPGVLAVESFEPESGVFPTHLFVSGGPELAAGRIHAPSTPGLGFELDWERIRKHATREACVGAPQNA
jgi:L-alanine-DL-glutamate epimerase-like enolase superfamily enzyme